MPSIARMAVQLSPDDRHAPSSQRGGQGFESPQLHRGVFPEFGETILRNPGLVRVRGQTCPMAPDHWSGAISGTGRLTDLIAVAGGSWWARPCFGEDLGGLEAEPGWAHGRGGDRFVDYALGGDHDKPRALPEAKAPGVTASAASSRPDMPGPSGEGPAGGGRHLLHQRLRALVVGGPALPAPEVQRFYTKDELALVIVGRSSGVTHWLHVDADSDGRRTLAGADAPGLRPERLSL
jgi:hypothetical protein